MGGVDGRVVTTRGARARGGRDGHQPMRAIRWAIAWALAFVGLAVLFASCAKSAPNGGSWIQDSTDYAPGGANGGATGGFWYGCQGGYAPPASPAPLLQTPNLDNSGRYVPNRPQRGY